MRDSVLDEISLQKGRRCFEMQQHLKLEVGMYLLNDSEMGQGWRAQKLHRQ